MPIFLTAAFTLLHPGGVATFFGVNQEYKYYFFIFGLAVYALALSIQKVRIKFFNAPTG